MPADVAAIEMRRRERIIGWAASTGDHRGSVVATNFALILVGGTHIPYDRVIRAGWEEPVLEVVVQMESGAPTTTLRLIMTAPGSVPVAVRDRVTASVLSQQHVPLRQDGKGARLVARKDIETGQVRWAVVFDVGLDPADPDLRAAADAALLNLRNSLGL
jgi:hypothetical protein